MENKYLIYALLDPETYDTRYIGKSSSGLKRPKAHFAPSSLSRNYPVSRWIRKLKDRGLTPIIEIIEDGAKENLNALEVYYIKEARNEGWRLLNLTDGGEGTFGRKVSEEVKKKMSILMKSRQIPPEQIARITALGHSNKGKKASQKIKEAMRRNSAKGIKVKCINNNKTYYSARHAKEDLPEIACHKQVLWSARNNKPLKNGLLFAFV